MPGMVPNTQPVLYRGELVRRRYLNGIILEMVVHGAFFTIWNPHFLKEDQLGREYTDDLAEIQKISVKSFYVESSQLHI